VPPILGCRPGAIVVSELLLEPHAAILDRHLRRLAPASQDVESLGGSEGDPTRARSEHHSIHRRCPFSCAEAVVLCSALVRQSARPSDAALRLDEFASTCRTSVDCQA